MSFFFHDERKLRLQKQGIPSPCDYNPSIVKTKVSAQVPFGSTTQLSRLMKKQKKNNIQIKQKQAEHDDMFAINDVNFKIKAQEQMSSMFKSGTGRFQSNNQPLPGPGEYQISKKASKKANKSLSHFSLHQSNYYDKVKPNPPSIPTDNLGFKEDEHNQMKKVKAQIKNPPHPGSYEIRTNLTGKGVVAWKPIKGFDKEQLALPGPGEYEGNKTLKGSKSLSSCFNSTTDRFGQIKRLKQQKAPGPGQYNPTVVKKLSHNITNQGYFNSKTSRFQSKRSDTVGPGVYFNQKSKSKSINHIRRYANHEEQQEKKVVKKTIFDIKNTNPGPGDYKTNYGISYQLHKSLLRKQNTTVLPQQKRIVFETKQNEELPGPGSYEPKVLTKAKKTIISKPVQVVNLKPQAEQVNPSPGTYHNLHNTIEAKIKQINSKITLTDEKPFNSGTQRFKHYSQQKPVIAEPIRNQEEEDIVNVLTGKDGKRVKRLVMTTIKVRVPFGISTNKYQEKQQHYEGPDFYNKPVTWIKPSFNLLGKIQ